MWNLLKSRFQQLRKDSLTGKSVTVLFLRGIGMFLFFGLTLFLTNTFDPDSVGQYDFSRSLLIFLGAFTVFGMNQSILFFSGYLESKQDAAHLRSVYLKMLGMMIGLSAILYLLTHFLGAMICDFIGVIELLPLIEQTVPFLAFYSITILNFEAFRAIHRIKLSEIFRNIVRYLFFFLGILWLYYYGSHDQLVSVFLWNFALISFLSTVWVFFYLMKLGPVTTAKDHVLSLKGILKRSAPMALSSTAFLLMQSFDIMMLAHFTDYSSVAFYGLAVKLTLLINVVLASVNAVIGPEIAALYTSNLIEKLRQKIAQSTQLIFFLTAPVILVFILFATFILSLFGTEYMVAKYVLWVLLLGQIMNSLCGPVGTYLNMTGKEKTFRNILFAALVINIVLNYLLIPQMGMMGAAIATSASMIFWNTLGIFYIYKTDRLRIFFRWPRIKSR